MLQKILIAVTFMIVVFGIAAYILLPSEPLAPAPELRVELSNRNVNLQEPRLVLSLWEGGVNYEAAERLQVRAISPNGADVWEGEGVLYEDYPVVYWVAQPAFSVTGEWTIELTAQIPDTQAADTRLTVTVEARPIGLTGDMMAYPSQTPTLDGDVQFYQITSDFSPRPGFYNYSIDTALASDRPSIIVFATPGLCTDRVNIYLIDYTMELVWREYGDTPLNIIHVEMVSPQTNDYVPAMQEWGIAIQDNLDSYLPWTYLVDADGTIIARYNGAVAFSELAPHIDSLLAGK